jgi:hypothetical protein
MNRLISLIGFVFLSSACTTVAATPDPDPATVAPSRLDPWAAAARWAADLDAARASSPDAAAALDGWEDAHVLRVWRDGDAWRALLAPKPDADSGPAALLTLTEDASGASVTSVEAASPTDLWPSI